MDLFFGLAALFFLSFFFLFLLLFNFFIFNNYFYFNKFISFYFLPSFLSFFLSFLPPSLPPSILSFFLSFLSFLPFLLSHAADRVLVLWPGVRPVPQRWESRVQDTSPPETSQLHVISKGETSSRDLHLNTKTQLHSTISKLQCWTPYAKQLARQEHNPTH